MSEAVLLPGDCLQSLKDLPDDSVDSIVTDPPYGLSFMGKRWDYDVPSIEIWQECLRVLKPGGHLLAFGGTRTYHRLVVAIEDAGFEVRDQLQWIYGSGFPKSMDISKAIDKAAGVEREVVGINPSSRPNSKVKGNKGFDEALGEGESAGVQSITAPATPEAKQWSGWGTALKPANEPICLARKPLSEKTVANNVLKHGVGGLNIDASRIEASADDQAMLDAAVKRMTGNDVQTDNATGNFVSGSKSIQPNSAIGRFPANVLFDEAAAEVLDAQSGVSKSGVRPPNADSDTGNGNTHGKMKGIATQRGFSDEGGASRFFYVAKASKKDRGEGNTHPTVKPVKLMEYLIKLVTPEGGIVLDPFMGSGTTGVAAVGLGHSFIGCEMSDEYLAIADARINQVTRAGVA